MSDTRNDDSSNAAKYLIYLNIIRVEMTFAEHILQFLFHLQLPFKLSKDVEVLDVHQNKDVQNACIKFYEKYYNDNHKRHVLLGINPGRFGGGVTGIPFTDPVRLQNLCGIENEWPKKQELSSVFIYDMINAFGGTEAFYYRFYISAISPLGFVKEGKNLNYYDDKSLMKKIEPFVADCINKQLSFGLSTDICFCIGEGMNLKYLQQFNEKYKWFNQIVGLPHPRFIMQYKLKQKEAYIQKYLDAFAKFT